MAMFQPQNWEIIVYIAWKSACKQRFYIEEAKTMRQMTVVESIDTRVQET